MRTALALGAHLDDLPLGIGQFLAGRPDVTAVTVFAGDPPPELGLTTYDETCGFASSVEAMTVRRAEDREAMSVLRARPMHLPFLDSQYALLTETADVAEALRKLIAEGDFEVVVGPLGLVHPDHELVRDALLMATEGLDGAPPLWLYEDLPSRVLVPESVPKAIHNLAKRGINLELGFIGTGPAADKMSALWSYKSQLHLPEFENRHCLLVPERFHRVVRG